MNAHIPYVPSPIYLFSVKRRTDMGASCISVPKMKKQFIQNAIYYTK